MTISLVPSENEQRHGEGEGDDSHSPFTTGTTLVKR